MDYNQPSFSVHGIFQARKLPGNSLWSGLLFPSPGDLPHPKTKLMSPVWSALAGRFFTTVPPGKPKYYLILLKRRFDQFFQNLIRKKIYLPLTICCTICLPPVCYPLRELAHSLPSCPSHCWTDLLESSLTKSDFFEIPHIAPNWPQGCTEQANSFGLFGALQRFEAENSSSVLSSLSVLAPGPLMPH